MQRSVIVRLSLVSISSVLLTTALGCIALGGGSKITNPTLGEELTALKISHDQGAITDQEYTNAKAKLLNQPRK
jgi:hypothetical protein